VSGKLPNVKFHEYQTGRHGEINRHYFGTRNYIISSAERFCSVIIASGS
jgi:hypothetical protein